MDKQEELTAEIFNKTYQDIDEFVFTVLGTKDKGKILKMHINNKFKSYSYRGRSIYLTYFIKYKGKEYTMTILHSEIDPISPPSNSYEILYEYNENFKKLNLNLILEKGRENFKKECSEPMYYHPAKAYVSIDQYNEIKNF